jgi:hypothetical protein
LSGKCFSHAAVTARSHSDASMVAALYYASRLGRRRRRSNKLCFSATNPSHSM